MASISPTKVVAFVSLFASGVWAQLNVAQCGAGYDWVRADAWLSDTSQENVTPQFPHRCLWPSTEP